MNYVGDAVVQFPYATLELLVKCMHWLFTDPALMVHVQGVHGLRKDAHTNHTLIVEFSSFLTARLHARSANISLWDFWGVEKN